MLFKNNTKTLCLVLLIMLLFSLVGCNQKEKGPEVHNQKNENYVAENLSNSEESSDLENMINNMDKYVEGIAISIKSLYDDNN